MHVVSLSARAMHTISKPTPLWLRFQARDTFHSDGRADSPGWRHPGRANARVRAAETGWWSREETARSPVRNGSLGSAPAPVGRWCLGEGVDYCRGSGGGLARLLFSTKDWECESSQRRLYSGSPSPI